MGPPFFSLVACADMSTAPSVVDRVTAWRLVIPMASVFQSAQSRVAERQVVLVRADGDGLSGWGEAAPVPGHTDEDIGHVWSRLEQTLSHPAGSELLSIPGLAGAALQQATIDLAAKQESVPLWQYLGGSRLVQAGAAIGVGEDGQPHRDQIEAAAASEYRHVKLKITPATQSPQVESIVAAYPSITFGADANASLDRSDEGLLQAIDRIDLAYLEQPGPTGDLDWHQHLRRTMTTPIALDEGAATEAQIERALADGAADIITLKAGRFGTGRTLALAREIVESGIGVRLGGLLETGVGRAHTVALAAHPIFDHPGDIAASDRYFADDLVRPQWRIQAGEIPLPDSPGIGVAVDPNSLERYADAVISSHI